MYTKSYFYNSKTLNKTSYPNTYHFPKLPHNSSPPYYITTPTSKKSPYQQHLKNFTTYLSIPPQLPKTFQKIKLKIYISSTFSFPTKLLTFPNFFSPIKLLNLLNKLQLHNFKSTKIPKNIYNIKLILIPSKSLFPPHNLKTSSFKIPLNIQNKKTITLTNFNLNSKLTNSQLLLPN